jgi:hypothetical protein
MRRRVLIVLTVMFGLGLAGCVTEASPEAQAFDDARRKVDQAYGDIADGPRSWPAEAYGRRAISAGFDLMVIDGDGSHTNRPGVTMVVRAVGQNA